KITLHDLADPVGVLDVDRLIETVLRPQLCAVLRADVQLRADHQVDDVAGNNPDHEEHEQRDPEQNGECQQQSFDYVGAQGSRARIRPESHFAGSDVGR